MWATPASPSRIRARATDRRPPGGVFTATLGSLASAPVAMFALIHGGDGSAWDWHLVAPALRERGHEAVAVDLPGDQESADWPAYARTVADAVAEARPLVVVGHSLGGFTAPLGCALIPVHPLVPVPPQIPPPRAPFAR